MQPARHIHSILLIALVIITPLLDGAGTARASDLAREQRIAEQIGGMILDGEVLRLSDGSHSFLAIHTPARKQPARGAALILHGRGANPDWVDVIHPLRTRLPESGWDTLAIQLPLAAAGASDREWAATVPESLPRIEAALAFLRDRGIDDIVIISHSFGTHAAANYLSRRSDDGVRAWVAIGMPPDARYAETDTLGLLGRIRIPVLDLFGELDLERTLLSAGARRKAAEKAGNAAYRQRQVPGADHFFSDLDDLLVSIVRGWMARTVGGAASQPPSSRVISSGGTGRPNR